MTIHVNIDEIIEGMSESVSINKDQKEKLQKVVKLIFEDGLQPKDALAISDQTIEAIYAHAYRFYQSAKYKDAGQIFRLLQTLNSADWRFYMGMGACLHRLGKYETASFMYQTAGDMAPNNPMPFYYCSDCRMKMGHFRKAVQLLKEVVKRCLGKKEYVAIRDRSLMTIGSLEQQSQQDKPKSAGALVNEEIQL